jgi:hypothetical protein
MVLVHPRASRADVAIYLTGAPNGFFVPFTRSTPAGKKFGDSGWVGSGGDPVLTGVNSITLGLATFSNSAPSVPAGTTDIVFTFNHGDPSGLVFGSGAEQYSVVIPNVTLPAADNVDPTYFDLTIPLPNLSLDGGFNNLGWSVGVQNFNYDGSFGFQNRSAFNVLGFMTGNASEFTPGFGWSLFSFGPLFPDNSANFVATVTIPEPASFALLAVGVLGMIRRR